MLQGAKTLKVPLKAHVEYLDIRPEADNSNQIRPLKVDPSSALFNQIIVKQMFEADVGGNPIMIKQCVVITVTDRTTKHIEYMDKFVADLDSIYKTSCSSRN